MILFNEDLLSQPIYLQTTTKNRSFLHMHSLLKKMGVKNNAFFLALTQKELLNVDPYTTKDPSPELAGRIMIECKINPWYYFREFCRVPAQGSPDGIPFELNRGNLALTWCFFNNFDTYYTIARQLGKTMTTQTIAGYLLYIHCTNFKFAMFAKDNELREDNVSRLKQIRDLWPSFAVSPNIADADNKHNLSYTTLKNTYVTAVARSDLLGADKSGRGATVPVYHIDEFEFYQNIRTTYPALVGATGTAREQAKKLGLPYGGIITTTAGRLETDSCQYALQIINKSLPFTEVLYDCKNIESLEEIVRNNSTNRMIYISYSYLQLGKTDAWIKDKIMRSGNDRDGILRDYLCVRTSGVDNSVIPVHLLEKVKNSCVDPVHTENVSNRYLFRWYVRPETVLNKEGSTLVMGLDTSENIGRDFTALVIVDARDMSVVCTARCNESDLIKLAIYIGKFMHVNSNTILIPERKSTASMMIGIICAELRKYNINPYTRIFNMIVQNKSEQPYKDIDISEKDLEEGPNKKYLGFTTTGGGETSRDALYSNTLMKTIELNYSRIRDATLITELSSLANKHGRVDHAISGHDDTVIAYLLACWFIFFGKNLGYYNVNTKSFLNMIGTNGNIVDAQYKEKQTAIYNQLMILKKKILNVTDPNMKNVLERELRNMETLLDSDIIETTPISTKQVQTTNQQAIHRDVLSIAKMYF